MVNIYTGSQHDYIVVQNCGGLAEIRGPYLHMQMAINELKKLAENCGNRWNKSNFLYLSDQYQKSESDTFEFDFMRSKKSGKRQTKNWPRHQRLAVKRIGGYCMMMIKITDGIIPNNCNGLSVIKKYGEEEWANVVVWDVQKMVEICQKNYSYMPY